MFSLLKKRSFIVIAMLMSILAMNAQTFTVGGVDYEITSTSNVRVVGLSYNVNIVIPSKVEYNSNEYFVRDIYTSAFKGTLIESIELPNSITSISSFAFENCTRLKSIRIPQGIYYIGRDAFKGCENLRDLYIEDQTSSTTPTLMISESAFDGCPIQNIYLGRQIEYTNLGSSPFKGNRGLGRVEIGTTITTLDIDDLFKNCSISSLILNPSLLTIGDNVFSGCTIYKTFFLQNTLPSMPNNVKGSVSYVSSASKFGFGTEYTNLSSMFTIGGVTYVPNPRTRTCDVIDCDCTNRVDDVVIDSIVTYKGVSLKVLDVKPYALMYKTVNNATIKNNGEIGLYAFSNVEGKNLIVANKGDIKSYAFSGSSFKGELFQVNNDSIIGENAFAGSNIDVEYAQISNKGNIEKKAFTGSVNNANLTIDNEGYIGEEAFSNVEGKNLIVANKGDIKSYAFSGSSFKGELFQVNNDSIIGENAFAGSNIDVEYAQISNKGNIEKKAFTGSVINANLTIDNEGYIGEQAFSNCSGIATLDLNCKGDVNNAAFSSFLGLQSVNFGERVFNMGNSVFSGCESLKNVNIPNHVLNIGESCFADCKSIESVIIGDGISTLNSSTFLNCSSLKQVKIGKAVKSVGISAFENCRSLPKISIPAGVQHLRYLGFTGCSSLKNVVIEDGGTALVMTTCSFSDSPLDSVYIGRELRSTTDAFRGNKTLRSVTYGNAAQTICNGKFKGCTNLQNLVLGDSITTIGEEAFANCSKLPRIVIPDKVVSLGKRSFYGCSDLSRATIGAGIKTLEQSTFENSGIRNVDMGVNVATINNAVFRGCKSLMEISIPPATTEVCDSVFYGCERLKRVIIEDRTDVLSLGSNGHSAESSAISSTCPLFNGCPLDSVYIGGKIKYNTSKEYGFSPFFRNTSLRTVVVADSETEVYDNEFYGCTGLTDVVVGDGVTKIGNWAFSGCESLKNFSFGSSVETIGAEAFSDCTSMEKLVSSSNEPPVCGDQALADIDKWLCTLYVPNEYVDAYYMADQWWDFFFIDGAEYKLTFMVGDQVYEEKMVKYGEAIELPAQTPTKEGYTFTGWENVPDAMPANDTVIKGVFTANLYTITFVVDDEVYKTVQVACDDSVVAIAAPEKEDYNFAHWEGLPETMPAHDVTVTAVYTEKVKEVSITINQYGSGTYCSDYSLDFSEVEGLKAYAATGFNKTTQYITLTRVMTAEAEVGLFIKGEPGTYVVPVIDESDDRSLNMLVATPVKTIVNSTSEGGAYSNFKYTIKSGESAPMFYQFADGSTLSAGKAYLQIPTDWLTVSNQKTIKIVFDEGESTDINEVQSEEDTTVVYDLSGRPVTNPSKGVYIVKGKKVYIK